MSNGALRAFREWLLTAIVAVVILEIAQQVLPGHWLTFRLSARLSGRRP